MITFVCALRSDTYNPPTGARTTAMFSCEVPAENKQLALAEVLLEYKRLFGNATSLDIKRPTIDDIHEALPPLVIPTEKGSEGA